ncbi:hypothetical protein C9J85_19115 [Haloferax sp. wsp5]|nr:hypothetical protein C9J85_19115 [Haloferax sp. wsp5]
MRASRRGHQLRPVVVAALLKRGDCDSAPRQSAPRCVHACEQGPRAITGISTERVVRATWIIGGGLTGVAG